MICGLKERLTPSTVSAVRLAQMPLNAYFLDCGMVPYSCCEVGGVTHYEDEILVGIAVAKSPASARYIFWKAHQDELGDLNEVEWKATRLVKRDVSLGMGAVYTQPVVVENSSYLWRLTCIEHWGRECGYTDHRVEADELGVSREDWELG